jgi:hypothetical protein
MPIEISTLPRELKILTKDGGIEKKTILTLLTCSKGEKGEH